MLIHVKIPGPLPNHPYFNPIHLITKHLLDRMKDQRIVLKYMYNIIKRIFYRSNVKINGTLSLNYF